MAKLSLEIINKLGLHARASTKFTQTASQFKSEVWVEKNSRRVNAKSIMGVMMLAAAKGSIIEIEATGADEEQAIAALQALVNDYFGEGE
ncbi:HPr family phosphocarrier protein [Methylophilus sp.]|jgi:phosphocarrier protein HPr|uniref:HPr family phosphocarrier protein n=1 Tax=Methylophilus sp. TaxID=29541 RepID=UPI0011D8C6DD|nr:HPr family phosphocarrier protein [Methylophilus sp.]TXI44297.1 MAG: HPr family phosphocarrier protein [Methylophilus sp.]